MVFGLSKLLLVVSVLINVAFFTLLERKILGLSQLRKGPNKVAIWGVLQPFADAIKLFLKEDFAPKSSSWGIFLIAPSMAFFLALWGWVIYPMSVSACSYDYSAVLLLLVMGLSLYPLLLAGWASNSSYASVGALRGVAQTISYEVGMALILLLFLLTVSGPKLGPLIYSSWSMISLFMTAPAVYLWTISCVAETNRTPFDFAEGESELVSGFNIEYGAGGFALIFMAEYASILLMSSLWGMLVLGMSLNNLLSVSTLLGLGSFWVWLRTTFPRYRYDFLMSLAWKSFLPEALLLLMLYSCLTAIFSQG